MSALDERVVWDDSPETFNYDGARRLLQSILLEAFKEAVEVLPALPPAERPAGWRPCTADSRESYAFWRRKWAKFRERQRLGVAKSDGPSQSALDKAYAVYRGPLAKLHASRDEARAFLMSEGDHFEQICYGAGVLPETVRAAADRLRVAGWQRHPVAREFDAAA